MNKNRLRKRMGSILLLFMVIFNSCDSGVIDSTNDKLTENTIKKPQNSNEATNQSSNEASNQNSNETTKMIEKIEFNDQELYLFLTDDEGNSGLLTVTITPENATDKALIWTSFDEKVATVDNTGKVTAVSAGKTLIAVKPKNGSGGEIYCDVTVYPNNSEDKPAFDDSDNPGWGNILNFVLNGDGRSYSIKSVKNDDEIAGEIQIPEMYQGYPVTAIQNEAFYGCGRLTKVVLPDSITSIGYNAFTECSSLEEINIPAGVREIREGVFSNCYNLKRVTFQGNVLAIADYAFDLCGELEELQLPDTIKGIAPFAFKDCRKLQRINVPQSLRAFGTKAFYRCGHIDPRPFNVGNVLDYEEDGPANQDAYQEYYDDHILPQLQ